MNAKEEEENMTPLHFAVQEKRIEVGLSLKKFSRARNYRACVLMIRM